MANDGVVDQAAVLAYARKSFAMIQELDSWKILARRIKRALVQVSNRIMATRIVVEGGPSSGCSGSTRAKATCTSSAARR